MGELGTIEHPAPATVRELLQSGGWEWPYIPEWLVDLCSRTYGDWHFFGVISVEDLGFSPKTARVLAWTNGERRTYVDFDSAKQEVMRHRVCKQELVDALWERLTYMMDRVDAHTTEAA